MAKETVQYKRTLSGSVGAGMGALLNGSGRQYYVLEHKDTSKYHRKGESQKIIIDQIELGRDNSCQVQYDDETWPMVSRRHAAIVKEKDGWKVIPMSQTNSTIVNGIRITSAQMLNNGDELQLAVDGPRMGFIVPAGKQSLVSSIRLTERLNLFRKQALRPYKRAIAILSTLFVIAMCVGGWFLYQAIDENKRLAKVVEEQQQELKEQTVRSQQAIDSVKQESKDLAAQLASIKSRFRGGGGGGGYRSVNPVITPTPGLEKYFKDIYFVVTTGATITMPDGEVIESECGGKDGVPGWTGTGFMLNDGRFVTARHVIEGWQFWKSGGSADESLLLLNMLANNGGKVVYHFVAVSSSGKRLQLSSNQFSMNRSGDMSATSDEGAKITLAQLNALDYAVARVGGGGLAYDAAKSASLERGTELTIFGFPLGLGVSSGNISPLQSKATCASTGLENGFIVTTATGFEQGNSGGPVFYTNSGGEMIVVGLVSAGAGRSTGFVVPIANIR